jgi:hypothetical protein
MFVPVATPDSEAELVAMIAGRTVLAVGHVARIFLVLMAAMLSVPVAAKDKVQIEYFQSYPRIDRSSPTTTIVVERSDGVYGPGVTVLDQEIDAYFKAVSEILSTHRVDRSWSNGGTLHPPLVRVTVTLGGKTLTLDSGYSSQKLETPMPPDGAPFRDALAELLQLTARRVQGTIPTW